MLCYKCNAWYDGGDPQYCPRCSEKIGAVTAADDTEGAHPMSDAELEQVIQYYLGRSDGELAGDYALGAGGYRDVEVWKAIEQEYERRRTRFPTDRADQPPPEEILEWPISPDLRERYSRLSDDKLVDMLVDGREGLTSDNAWQLLQEEVLRRSGHSAAEDQASDSEEQAFCVNCIVSTDRFTPNIGIGIKYGSGFRWWGSHDPCPECHSVIRTLRASYLWIPVSVGTRYRVIDLEGSKSLVRRVRTKR